MPTITTMGLYDCESIIQLAAGINLAFPIAATLRQPGQRAFGRVILREERRLNELASEIDAPENMCPISPDDLKQARISVICAKAEIEHIRSRFKQCVEEWGSDDNYVLALQVFLSLISIFLLFVAATSPDTQIDVPASKYNDLHHFYATLGDTIVYLCLFLYGPFFFSLAKLCVRQIYMRHLEKKLRETVKYVYHDVKEIFATSP